MKSKTRFPILIFGVIICVVVIFIAFRFLNKPIDRTLGFNVNDISDQYVLEGFGKNELISPRGIAIDQSGNIYVSDYRKHRIVVFNQLGEVIQTIGKLGKGSGELLRPTGITIANNLLYVADAGNYRIQIFSLDGDFQRKIKLENNIEPRDIVILDNNIYFTIDSLVPKNHKIYQIDEKNQIHSMGRYQMGYLEKLDDKSILFINQVIFKKNKDQWEGHSGIHKLYYIKNEKLYPSKIVLPYKYYPKDFVYDKTTEMYYIICGMYASINRHSKDGKYLDTIYQGNLSPNELDSITMDHKGTIYFTSPQKGQFFRLSSR